MRGRMLVLLIALSCGGATPPESKAPPPAPRRYQVNLPEFRGTLPNGITLVALPDETTDLVTVHVRHFVGWDADPPGKFGLAHLAEHLVFQKRPSGPARPPLFDQLRDHTLFMNAYTSGDWTHFVYLATKDELPNVLSLEVLRMAGSCRSIPSEEFQREREVVKNEERQGGSREVDVHRRLLAALYPEGHPYGRALGREQLDTVGAEDVCGFMRDHYVPERTVVIVSGNISAAEMNTLARSHFLPLPRGRPIADPAVPAVAFAGEHVNVTLPISRPVLVVAWPLPPLYTAEGSLSLFVANLLERQLRRNLVWNPAFQDVNKIHVAIVGGPRAPLLTAALHLQEAAASQAAEDQLWKVVEGLSAITSATANDKVFQRAREAAVAEMVMDASDLVQRAFTFSDAFQFDPNGDGLVGLLDRTNAMDRRAIAALAADRLVPAKARVLRIEAEAGADDEEDLTLRYVPTGERHHEIAPGEAKAARQPLAVPAAPALARRTKRFILDNGLKVLLVPDATSMPIVRIELAIGVGEADEPPNGEGVAHLVAALIEAAASQTISGLTHRVGADGTFFAVEGLEVFIDDMLRALGPLMIDDKLSWAYGYAGRAIQREREKPRSAALMALVREIAAAVYGPRHAYATAKTSAALDNSQFGREWRALYYTADNATLIVAGQFDSAAAEATIRQAFEQWRSGRSHRVARLAAAVRKNPIYVGIVRGKGATVPISIAYPGFVGTDPQLAERLVLAEILDRRSMEVRSVLGASYSASTEYHRLLGPGYYHVRAQVDAVRAGEVLRRLRTAIDGVRRGRDGLDALFVAARRSVMERLLVTPTGIRELTSDLALLSLHGETLSDRLRVAERVARLTPEDILRVAAVDLDPAKEVVIATGKKADIDRMFHEIGVTSPRVIELPPDNKNTKK